jgi:hypothetical protein
MGAELNPAQRLHAWGQSLWAKAGGPETRSDP